MALRAAQWEAMTVLQAATTDPCGHGWVTPGCGISEATFRVLEGLGLCEMADTSTRAKLATGNHLAWAARLAPDGHDLLLYRPADQDHSRAWLTKQASEGYQEIALQPSEMTMLRRFVALAPRLSHSPAEGLEDAVLEAHWDADCNRWRLQVNRDQMDSIARAFYLERFAGMTTASNRFARKYEVMHRRPHTAR